MPGAAAKLKYSMGGFEFAMTDKFVKSWPFIKRLGVEFSPEPVVKFFYRVFIQ